MMHLTVAFGTQISALGLNTEQEFGWYADIAATEVMKQSLARQMRPPAAGTDLTHVEVMAAAFGTQADPIEETLFEIITAGEEAKTASDIVTERNICIAVLGIWFSRGRNRPAGQSYLPQEV
jgi:hypothetical protein